MKVVVVGAGVTGFAAALAARSQGAEVTVITGSAGATRLAGGLWDIASDPHDDPLAEPCALADAIARYAARRPYHPYARLHGDLVAAVLEAHDAVLGALALYRPVTADGTAVLAATDLGMLRRAATAQHQVLALDALTGSTVAVIGLDGYRDLDASFVAASLSALTARSDERRFSAVQVEFVRRRSDATRFGFELAALFDDPEARVHAARVLERAIAGAGFDAALFPPLLGLKQPEVGVATVLEDLQASGLAVGEVASSLASPQSLRLADAIDRALAAACDVRSSPVTAIELGPDVQVTLEDEVVSADAIVLATGKLLGGGIVVRAGRYAESILGLPIYEDGRPARGASSAAGPDPARLYAGASLASLSAHRRGVGFDGALRALDRRGGIVSERLFVAGALLDGYSVTDGSGLGCCATTGWRAGLAAAGLFP